MSDNQTCKPGIYLEASVNVTSTLTAAETNSNCRRITQYIIIHALV